MSKLIFKISVPKPKAKPKNTIKIGGKHQGKVYIDENGEYKVLIDMHNDEDFPDMLNLSFTENSFELKGRETIFSRKKDERNHYIRIERSKTYATVNPADPNKYVPFAPNWIVSGNIVRDKADNKLKFDFNALLNKNG